MLSNCTLPKTNIANENARLEDEMSYWKGLFSGDMFFFRVDPVLSGVIASILISHMFDAYAMHPTSLK